MAEEVETVDDDKMDVIGTAIDVVSIGVGGVVGWAGGEIVEGMLPVAKTTVEVVRNKVAKYGTLIMLQKLTSDALASDISEIRNCIHGIATRKKSEPKADEKKN